MENSKFYINFNEDELKLYKALVNECSQHFSNADKFYHIFDKGYITHDEFRMIGCLEYPWCQDYGYGSYFDVGIDIDLDVYDKLYKFLENVIYSIIRYYDFSEIDDKDPEYPNNLFHTGYKFEDIDFYDWYSGCAGHYWNTMLKMY